MQFVHTSNEADNEYEIPYMPLGGHVFGRTEYAGNHISTANFLQTVSMSVTIATLWNNLMLLSQFA